MDVCLDSLRILRMRACMSLDVTSTASISLARETCASACSESRGRAGVFTCQNTIRDISPWMSLSRTKPTWRTFGPTAKKPCGAARLVKASRCCRGYWYAVAAAGQSRYVIKVTVASTQSTCAVGSVAKRSEEHTSELQSPDHI